MQKKDAFYQNKSLFSDDPMVHLLPHWNWQGLEGEIISVWAYTNCEELELFLNGESLGRKAIEKFGHGEWQVSYAPGTIEVKAYIGGKEICSDAKTTSGAAHRLVLTQDTLDVRANGDDIAIFSCSVVDENGLEVPNANIPLVSFYASGDCSVYSTGSDISDHGYLLCPDRRMREGRISVALKLGNDKNQMKLYAKAEGLISAVINVTTE